MTNFPFISLSGWSRSAVLPALGMPLLLACSKDKDSPATQPSTTYSPAVQMGSGSARSFISADASGKKDIISLKDLVVR